MQHCLGSTIPNFLEFQKAIYHQCKLPQNHAFHNENYQRIDIKTNLQ